MSKERRTKTRRLTGDKGMGQAVRYYTGEGYERERERKNVSRHVPTPHGDDPVSPERPDAESTRINATTPPSHHHTTTSPPPPHHHHHTTTTERTTSSSLTKRISSARLCISVSFGRVISLAIANSLPSPTPPTPCRDRFFAKEFRAGESSRKIAR